MTFKLLKEIIEKNNIPEDVGLASDHTEYDRWCRLENVYYDKEHHELYLTDGDEDPAWDYAYKDLLCLYRDDPGKEEEVDGNTSL